MQRKTARRKPEAAKNMHTTKGLATPNTPKMLAVPERVTPETQPPVTITTLDGVVFEIADTPANPGRTAALASEPTLRKFWDTFPPYPK